MGPTQVFSFRRVRYWGRKSVSRVQFFATPWTVASQVPLSVGFSGKDTTPVPGLPSLLQGIFPYQGLNPGLSHGRQILYGLNHQGSPIWAGL